MNAFQVARYLRCVLDDDRRNEAEAAHTRADEGAAMLRSDTQQLETRSPQSRPALPGTADTDRFPEVSLIDEARRVGLCVTCDHSPTCSYRRMQTGPVIHCEEFT